MACLYLGQNIQQRGDDRLSIFVGKLITSQLSSNKPYISKLLNLRFVKFGHASFKT